MGLVAAGMMTVAGHAADRGHLDSPMLIEGCGSCHVGHGMSNEPMLQHGEEQFCYQCHGSEEGIARMQSAGRLSVLADPVRLESVFEKPFRHPVERSGDHKPGEQLPALTASDHNRHAECVDCHNPHSRSEIVSRGEVAGFTLSGTRVDRANAEYEVCLKCHSDDQSRDGRERNLRLLLGPSARSSHPIATPASGVNSPSLTGAATLSRQITCSDCHGNDDPTGPKGPHGSSYPALLIDRYDTSPLAEETGYSFALCYRCHDRSSIMNNESFPYHKEHILGDPGGRIPGTSCATCHNAHGSLDASHLIDFNPTVAGPTQYGPARFVDLGEKHGECYVMCHDHSHSPARY